MMSFYYLLINDLLVKKLLKIMVSFLLMIRYHFKKGLTQKLKILDIYMILPQKGILVQKYVNFQIQKPLYFNKF